jgi:hypothetical protein
MAYTNIDDPSAYFQTALFSGNGSTVVAVTNDGNSDLQPDLLWFKRRDGAVSHAIIDTNRGANVTSGFGPTGYNIVSNTNSTATEVADNTGVMTITSDGFTVKEMTYASGNMSTGSMCCWQWHCNAGDRITFNESGGNPGGVRQTNATAGLSIIVYTGTGSNGTIAHGLGKAPEFLIFKRGNATNVWATWHQALGDDYKIVLNSTDAKDSDGAFMNSTLPTSTNITVGGASTNTNADGGTYLCYAWTSIQGYSKFGKYVGNSNANGPFIYLGFKPAFVMLKRTNTTSNWIIMDSKRNAFNEMESRLFPNLGNAEQTQSTYGLDFLSNGFKLRDTVSQSNGSGSTYIYMAFAENPFTTSTGIPTTAR